MKLIIAGSRGLHADIVEIVELLKYHKLYPTEIVSGTAQGIDRCGEEFAKYARLKLTQFPADWGKYGRSAGPIRNRQMAEYADALLLIWTDKSPGSANMKAVMRELGKPVFEAIVRS